MIYFVLLLTLLEISTLNVPCHVMLCARNTGISINLRVRFSVRQEDTCNMMVNTPASKAQNNLYSALWSCKESKR
jgi:hypothetical protein